MTFRDVTGPYPKVPGSNLGLSDHLIITLIAVLTQPIDGTKRDYNWLFHLYYIVAHSEAENETKTPV